ncbi:MAG: hypothetical protein ACQEVA_18940 [Myxococcota bacterium]
MMKHLRLLLAASFLVSTSLFALACDKTSQEEAEEESKTMEKAKEKAEVKPSGTEDEDNDTPIEGTPEEVIGEMNREIDAYQNKIYSSSKDVPEDLRTKVDAAEAQVQKLEDSLSVDELKAEELTEETNATVAEIKKEWNQTKRQVDVALGTTESETEEDE